jgi:hypothetical protein
VGDRCGQSNKRTLEKKVSQTKKIELAKEEEEKAL